MKGAFRMALGAFISAGIILVLFMNGGALAAYNHQGDIDSINFRACHPERVGTKLDSCTLCHSGGSYQDKDKKMTLGSCQWCHYKYGYKPPHGNILETLNQYGKDYLARGRSVAAIAAIASNDSDGDGYSNGVEITAVRFPGDPNDTPAKVPAPYRIYDRDQLEQMPQHKQFLLMNVSKSSGGDSYVEYSGVVMEELLTRAGMLPGATDIVVSSPDGFSWGHPLFPPASQVPNNLQYFVIGPYPQGTYFYDAVADMKLNPNYGWCNYSASSCIGRQNGDLIDDDLRLLLGIARDGVYLTPGVLNSSNKLDGEGPFRVIPPQVIPGPPDQASTSKRQDVIWPYNSDYDHNAGASTRSTTIIKVAPLPPGTTDIDLLEAGWNYIDENKIVIYGALDPTPTIIEKLDDLWVAINETNRAKFQNPSSQRVLLQKVEVVKKQIQHGAYGGSMDKLQGDLMQKTDGCIIAGSVDKNDWVNDCSIQKQFYWAMNEILVLLNILR